MLQEINWEPFLITVQVVAIFAAICFAAGCSDVWAKGSRKPKVRREPVAFHKGERIYLN
ncbi:MAG TPA: hypothetical protein PLX06_11220 [Fimbriimonadaceae bacterium]|nr:hypothetical protein [Fimbriimonadaceae bacterium]